MPHPMYLKMEKVSDKLVGKFGAQAVILRYSHGGTTPDPDNPWEGTTEPEQVVAAYPCFILIDYSSRLLNGSTIISPKLLIAKKGLLIKPNNDDLIQLSEEDRAFQIDSVRPQMPGGHTMYWEVTAR